MALYIYIYIYTQLHIEIDIETLILISKAGGFGGTHKYSLVLEAR